MKLTNSEKYRRYREKHLKLGLCTRCSELALEGHTRCKKHHEEHNEDTREQGKRFRKEHPEECHKRDCIKRKKVKDKHKKLGLCIHCSNPVKPGFTLCEKCSKNKKLYEKNKYRYYRNNYWCTRCHKRKSAPGSVLCGACLGKVAKYDSIRRDKWRKAGLCIGCGRILPEDNFGYTKCPSCRSKPITQCFLPFNKDDLDYKEKIEKIMLDNNIKLK